MEKLIELLNEYEKKTVVHWYEWYCQGNLMCRYIKDNFEFYTDEATTIAISKYYGFIKRLVDNDKIKYNKVPEHIYVSDYSFETIHKGMTDNILMWLAIQDNQIEFLISILK